MRISLRSAGWLTGVVLTLVLAILWSATAAAGAEEGPGYDTPLYSYDASVDLAPSSIAALSAMETGADLSGIAVASAATARGRIYDSSADFVAPTSAVDDVGLSNRGLVPAAGTRVRPAGVPDEWRIVPTRGDGGVRYYDPTNPGNSVRVMQGNPNSPFPNSQASYVRWQHNGQPLDVNGNVLSTAQTPAAHIPLQDFVFRPQVFGP